MTKTEKGETPMRSLVVFDISLSVDGFMRGPNPTPDKPLGDGGEALHAWVGSEATEEDHRLLADAIGGAGAIICGRRTYDDSLPSWGADGPTGPARLPVFVVSHSTAPAVPGGVYRFAGGIASALESAHAAADGKDICIMGGADIGRQFLRSGLVDELSLHVAPVLLGGGIRMFDDALASQATLERRSVVTTKAAVHLRYVMARAAGDHAAASSAGDQHEDGGRS